jgi:hypothetical protein
MDEYSDLSDLSGVSGLRHVQCTNPDVWWHIHSNKYLSAVNEQDLNKQNNIPRECTFLHEI